MTLFPVPTIDTTLHFTYHLIDNGSAFDSDDPFTNGIANLSNVPFGNINYTTINSMGRQWIRRYALALSKEILGQVRSKVSDIPIPNGNLTLNGPALVNEAQLEKDNLRIELKEWLESMTYDKLAEQETNQAENLMRQLAKVPLGIYVGDLLLILTTYGIIEKISGG